MFGLEKYFFDFFDKVFYLEKNYFVFGFFLCQSEIFSGIQKPYLENRASILKLFKIKKPIILRQISGFPYTSVQCYVHRPLRHPFSLRQDFYFSSARSLSFSTLFKVFFFARNLRSAPNFWFPDLKRLRDVPRLESALWDRLPAPRWAVGAA